MIPLKPNYQDSRENKASDWVENYTALTTVLVFAVCGIPATATVIVVALEVTMFYHLGKILYKQEWTCQGIGRVADYILMRIIGIPIIIVNIAALEIAIFAVNEAFAIKSAIAASIVRTSGVLLFRILEEIGRSKTNGKGIVLSK